MRKMDLARRGVAVALALAMAGCSALGSVKETFLGGSSPSGPERLTGFIGAVVADEPRAALAGREVLITGGNAADAAAATMLALAVTLPSRAGLGSGGACLAYSPERSGPGGGRPEAIVFTPVAGQSGGADRPASVPMLARGVFALQTRYGTMPFEQLLGSAEQLARFGTPASRTLARDLALVAGPLTADPNARAVFAPGGVVLTEGATLTQPELGATLSTLRTQGVGDLYQGALARRMEAASRLAGGPLSYEEMRSALPRTVPPIVVEAGRDLVAFLPPPADGGLAAAAAFGVLRSGADAASAQARGLGAASRWRAGGATAAQAMAAPAASAGAGTPMGASTSIAVLDRNGNAVTCALTMNNLFGTGRMAPGTGVLLGAAPRAAGAPLLAAALAWNANLNAFRAAVGSSGQEGAALAVALGMEDALRGAGQVAPRAPEPGRSNVIGCARYLPGSEGSCSWATDPRGSGLASSGN